MLRQLHANATRTSDHLPVSNAVVCQFELKRTKLRVRSIQASKYADSCCAKPRKQVRSSAAPPYCSSRDEGLELLVACLMKLPQQGSIASASCRGANIRSFQRDSHGLLDSSLLKESDNVLRQFMSSSRAHKTYRLTLLLSTHSITLH